MSDTVENDDDMLAAEYVLGVLDGPQRQAVDARAAREPALAAGIGAWEKLLHPLAVLVPPVQAPLELWPRLSRAVGSAAATPSLAAQSVRMWRNTAYMAMAVAAGFAVFSFLPAAPRPVALAALAPLNGAVPAFMVRVLPDGGLAIAAIAPAAVPDGRDLELWALPKGAAAVVALGVLPAGGAHIAASRLTAPGGKLLVSLEPKGGSPTGQPTGPVLYGGVITVL